MKVNIVSWNTQGSAPIKISEHGKDIVIKGILNFILLQESGSVTDRADIALLNDKINGMRFNGYFATQPNAKNFRCTVGMYVPETMPSIYQYNVSSFNCFKCSALTRPIVSYNASINGKDYLIATMHAKSDSSKSPYEIATALEYVIGSGVRNWILMGDFNCPPSTFNKVFMGTKYMAYLKYDSSCATQLSGNILDYCFCSDTLLPHITVKCGFPKDPIYTSSQSDHCMISTSFDTDNVI